MNDNTQTGTDTPGTSAAPRVFALTSLVDGFLTAQTALQEAKNHHRTFNNFVNLLADMLYPYYNTASRGQIKLLHAKLRDSIERCAAVGVTVSAGYVNLRKEKDSIPDVRIDMDSLQELYEEKKAHPNFGVNGKKSIADKFYERDALHITHKKEHEQAYNEAERQLSRIEHAKDVMLSCSAKADTSVFDAKIEELAATIRGMRENALGKYREHVVFAKPPIELIGVGVPGEVPRFRFRLPNGVGTLQEFESRTQGL